jgi:phycocyanobilin:ferredoxin oxidoreductase
MAEAAAGFSARLSAVPGCKILPPPPVETAGGALQWDNILLTADRFRRAHVETFCAAGRVSVLHVCILPHLDDPGPIFGFDMIAGAARVSGIFLDLSPVVLPDRGLRLRDAVGMAALAGFTERRERPPWGGIFSEDFLAVRPRDLDEVGRAIGLAHVALEAALTVRPPDGRTSVPEVAAGQDRYLAAQRCNEHTLRMLAGFIGHKPARQFIDDVLFPITDLPSAA